MLYYLTTFINLNKLIKLIFGGSDYIDAKFTSHFGCTSLRKKIHDLGTISAVKGDVIRHPATVKYLNTSRRSNSNTNHQFGYSLSKRSPVSVLLRRGAKWVFVEIRTTADRKMVCKGISWINGHPNSNYIFTRYAYHFLWFERRICSVTMAGEMCGNVNFIDT